ncbi:protein ERGIC-53-like [Ornithorhynchus anatinus]|uniref:protein ERGIC-53-like n=1 Tax=Ornithorhynchus anatinus TaxID=9258 RepID=UPI0019D4919D|nr:protein ERGIC-53-like [Ornithorhynchus anatinus]
MAPSPAPLLLLLLLPLLTLPLLHDWAWNGATRRRFEYKFSFRGPRLAQPGREMPFWSHHGDAIPGLEEVRLVPSMRNKSGAVWTRNRIPFLNWEVEVAIRVSGLGRLGADGMAIWYSQERGQTGPALGGPALWEGIGIFLDSFDDDAQNNPAIQVVASNGRIPYDRLKDGGAQVLGSCVRDFRNRLHPFRVKITYWREKLRVSINSGFTAHGGVDELCTEVAPLSLSPSGFFGVSASTSSLADDHDVLSFSTFSLSEAAPEVMSSPNGVWSGLGDRGDMPWPGLFQSLPLEGRLLCSIAPDAWIPEAEQHRLQQRLKDLQKEVMSRKDSSKLDLTSPNLGDRSFEQAMTLERHSRILQELQGLSEKMTQTAAQWKHQLSSLGGPGREEAQDPRAGEWNSVASSTLLKSQEALLQDLQEMRAAAARIASRAETFYLPVGTEHHFPELERSISLLQMDVQSLLNLPKSTKKLHCQSGLLGTSCLSRGIFLLFLLIQTGCAFYYVLFRRLIPIEGCHFLSGADAQGSESGSRRGRKMSKCPSGFSRGAIGKKPQVVI